MPQQGRKKLALVPTCQPLDARIAPSGFGNFLMDWIKSAKAELEGGSKQPSSHRSAVHATSAVAAHHVAPKAHHHPHRVR